MTVTTNKLVKKNGKASAIVTVERIASVPDPSIADKYVGRTIGVSTEFEIFDFALARGFNVLLEGDTGTGKTMAAMAYAASKGMHFYSTPNNIGIEPSQLFGKYIPDEDGISLAFWQDGPVTDMVKHGGVLLINEVNFLPPRVATVLFSLLDGRREIALLEHKGEVIKAHPELLIIADMNPDYIGTQQLNAAFRNRFEIQLDWDYDPNVEASLVKSKTLREFAVNIRKARRKNDVETPTSTNMLIEFEEVVSTLGLKFALANLVQHYSTDDRKAVVEALRTITPNLEADYAKLAVPEPAATAKPKPVSEDWDFVDDDTNKWLNDL